MPRDTAHTPHHQPELPQTDALRRLSVARGPLLFLARAGDPATRAAAQHLLNAMDAQADIAGGRAA
jgi:hypothetical protein